MVPGTLESARQGFTVAKRPFLVSQVARPVSRTRPPGAAETLRPTKDARALTPGADGIDGIDGTTPVSGPSPG